MTISNGNINKELSNNIKIDQLIRRGASAIYANEYGVKTRRLFPWIGKVNTKRQLTEAGCMFVLLAPGEFVDPHKHNEEETFIVLSGQAILAINEEQTVIGKGDVAYIPRHSIHEIRNASDNENFEMLDIYWDENGKSDWHID